MKECLEKHFKYVLWNLWSIEEINAEVFLSPRKMSEQEANWSSLQWKDEQRGKGGVVVSEEAIVNECSLLPKCLGYSDGIESIPLKNQPWWVSNLTVTFNGAAAKGKMRHISQKMQHY